MKQTSHYIVYTFHYLQYIYYVLTRRVEIENKEAMRSYERHYISLFIPQCEAGRFFQENTRERVVLQLTLLMFEVYTNYNNSRITIHTCFRLTGKYEFKFSYYNVIKRHALSDVRWGKIVY